MSEEQAKSELELRCLVFWSSISPAHLHVASPGRGRSGLGEGRWSHPKLWISRGPREGAPQGCLGSGEEEAEYVGPRVNLGVKTEGRCPLSLSSIVTEF